MLDYRILTFLSVAKNMSFTKAAEELNITQPAVSQHIKYIEDFYNTKLFLFNGKKMSLTKEGQILLNASTTMLHDSIHLKDTLGLIKREEKKISFGVTLTVGEYVIPYKLKKLAMRANDICIRVDNTNSLLEEINNGNVDFALVEGYFEKREYDYITYDEDKYVAVANKEMEVNSIEELLNETIILREVGSGTRAIFENILASHNMNIDDFKGKIEINNIQAIKKMVAQGMGISFMYKRAVEKEIKEKKLFEIEIKNFNLSYNFTFVWRKNSIYANYYKGIYELIKWF